VKDAIHVAKLHTIYQLAEDGFCSFLLRTIALSYTMPALKSHFWWKLCGLSCADGLYRKDKSALATYCNSLPVTYKERKTRQKTAASILLAPQGSSKLKREGKDLGGIFGDRLFS